MNERIVSALFHDRDAAEHAITKMRRAGVPDEAIAVMSRHDDEVHHVDRNHDDDHETADNKGTGALKGLAVGGGVGALFGLGALVVPGIGPFIAAGSLIETLGVVGSAAASGAIVGGTAGGIAGALMNYGVSEAEARDYEQAIRDGGIWVGVDTRRTAAGRDLIAGMLRNEGAERIDSRQVENT